MSVYQETVVPRAVYFYNQHYKFIGILLVEYEAIYSHNVKKNISYL